MKFGHKIGLAFLALTVLTMATGCIGLLFVYRVLSILGTVSDEEGPLIRNLEDLNRYTKKAVTISRDVSEDLDVADLVALRREFSRVAHEFDRAFQEIRKEVEDEISLGRIEAMSTEQRELKEQTQYLITAIIDELQVERQVNERLLASQSSWRKLVELLGSETVDEPGSASSSTVEVSGLEDSARSGSAGDPLRLQRLQVLPQVQHLLMLVRLELNDYFATEDTRELEQSDLRVRALFARSTAAVGALYAFSLQPGADLRTEGIEAAFTAWRDAFTQPDGALELYKRKVELALRTDLLSASIQVEARDTLRVLDSLVSVRNLLVARKGERGFVRAAPSLLILTIAAATVVSALMGIILTMNITKPVRKLIVAAEAVGGGDYSHRLAIESGDELAHLGNAFNRMTGEIARSQEKIRSLNVGLEQRVKERTRELEDEIRERRKAVLSLRESEDRYRTLIESFPSGVIALVDRSFKLIAVGGEGLRRAGAGPGDFVGRYLEEFCPPELAVELLPRLEAAFGGTHQEFECPAAGAEWHVTVVCNPSAEDALPETVTVLALDVTEAKRNAEQMEQKHQQLIQAEKLASLGILAAGMAHEINNPNQAIMTGGQLAAKAWPDVRRVMDEYFEREGDYLVGGTSYSALRESLGDHLQSIVGSAKRIEAIVSSLKGFARQDHTDMTQLVDLNLVVESALVLLSNLVKKATDHLSVDLSPGLPAFRGNAQQVEQVVVNLVHNACQAVLDRRLPISITTYRDGGREGIVLEVRDGGVGIPPDQLQRVMDPFFTTKRDSGGTGLGLSVSASIVKEHRGTLEFASEPGKGTTVRAWFPAEDVTDRRAT